MSEQGTLKIVRKDFTMEKRAAQRAVTKRPPPAVRKSSDEPFSEQSETNTALSLTMGSQEKKNESSAPPASNETPRNPETSEETSSESSASFNLKESSEHRSQASFLSETGRFTAFLYKLSGVSPEIMARCAPASRAKFVSLGLLVIIVSVAAFASMSHMVFQIDGFGYSALLVGAVWGIFWGVLEVLILSSAKSVGASLFSRVTAFALRASLAVIPVVSFSTIWFIETNRPELRVAIENLRIERETAASSALRAGIGVDGDEAARNSAAMELEEAKSMGTRKPFFVEKAEREVGSATKTANAAASRFHAAAADLDKAQKDGASEQKIARAENKKKMAETDMKNARRFLDKAKDELASAIDEHRRISDEHMENAQRRLSAANASAAASQNRLAERTLEFSKATAAASSDHFSSQLSGVFHLLSSDSGKRWQFAFWFVALMLVELAAIGMKVFVVTDADVQHAYLAEKNMRQAAFEQEEHERRIKAEAEISELRERTRVAVETAKAEAFIKETSDKSHLIAKAVAPYDIFEDYRRIVESRRGGTVESFSPDMQELLKVADKASANEMRRMLSRIATPSHSMGSFPRKPSAETQSS